MKLTEIYREAMESFAKERSFPTICAGTEKSSADSILLIGPGSLQPSPKMPLSSVVVETRIVQKDLPDALTPSDEAMSEIRKKIAYSLELFQFRNNVTALIPRLPRKIK